MSMDKVTIPIGGMTCGGCVKSIENALLRRAGVGVAKASLENKSVTVEFDAGIVQQPVLEDAIIKAGFTVSR